MTPLIKPWQRWTTCERCGKRSYQTRKDARRTIRAMRKTAKVGKGQVLDVYQCGQLWHIGHSTTRDGKPGRR